MTHPFITFRDLRRQLYKDLIGKDSYRGVTLTYAWLANQFGHFALGFIPVILLERWAGPVFHWYPSAPVVACIVTAAWVVFEAINFLGPLVSRRKKIPYVFPPRWGNITFDTITDLGFFSFGAFAAAATPLVVVPLILALLYPAYWWYTCKMYLQFAEYPAQIRLGQWKLRISEDDKKTVSDFLRVKDQGNQLLVFGNRGSGKTSLSIALATEISLRREACFYTSAMKLLSLFFEPVMPDEYTDSDGIFWDWRSTSLLVIDDLNPGEPVHNLLITADTFESIAAIGSKNNMQILAAKNVIWVAGSDGNDKAFRDSWEAMLQRVGVPDEKISSIHLGETAKAATTAQVAQAN